MRCHLSECLGYQQMKRRGKAPGDEDRTGSGVRQEAFLDYELGQELLLGPAQFEEVRSAHTLSCPPLSFPRTALAGRSSQAFFPWVS